MKSQKTGSEKPLKLVFRAYKKSVNINLSGAALVFFGVKGVNPYFCQKTRPNL